MGGVFCFANSTRLRSYSFFCLAALTLLYTRKSIHIGPQFRMRHREGLIARLVLLTNTNGSNVDAGLEAGRANVEVGQPTNEVVWDLTLTASKASGSRCWEALKALQFIFMRALSRLASLSIDADIILKPTLLMGGINSFGYRSYMKGTFSEFTFIEIL
ncbi:hypothetical protein VNO77_08250 [Canavalia gladiata]|uniref:Uncharacterized protein n=1 Tax=Canavalia gladiata TaxID=3824 RepID=A0AAN9QWJ0_CANGL